MAQWTSFDRRVEWSPVSGEDVAGMLRRLGDDEVSAPLNAARLTVRVASLPFYRGFRLYWLSRRDPQAGLLNAFALVSDAGAAFLDRSGGPVHWVNEQEALQLRDEDLECYLRFFIFSVRGEEHTFLPVGSAAELNLDRLSGEHDAKHREAIRQALDALAPLTLEPGEAGGTAYLRATLGYSDTLFACRFALERNGTVEMLDDTMLVDRLPPGLLPEVPSIDPLPRVLGLSQAALEGARAAARAARPGQSRPTPPKDRHTTQQFVAALFEHALAAVQGNRLLERFNSESLGPLERFGRFLLASWPVVVIESDMDFVEELIADLLLDEGNLQVSVIRPSQEGDDGRLRVSLGSAEHSIVLMPLQGSRTVADLQRVAHDIAVRDIAALIGCTRAAHLPEPLRRAADLVLCLPALDEALFAALFERILDAPPPAGWQEGGTHWVRYLVATDFHQPCKLAMHPDDALAYLRERVTERLRHVEPSQGPGLAQLHGLGEAKQMALDLITDIQAAMAGELAWAAVDRGMLLCGPPGTGKTTLARAMAKECGVKFVGASASAWQAAGHLGDHIRAIRADFAEARRYAPAILFIDEIDSIGSRQNFSGPNAQYSTEVVNALLEQIQGLDEDAPVFVIAATNHPDRVDPALRRAGRLDRVVSIPYPNVEALDAIFQFYLRPHGEAGQVDAGVDTHVLGAMAFGLTGADVELFVRGAARRARRRGGPITQADLVAEITGKPRSEEGACRLTDAEMRRVAVHESGHAMAQYLGAEGGASIGYVSIVPRSEGTLGFVASIPRTANLMTRAQYMALLEVFLAGRAAEELEFGADGVSGGAGGPSQRSDLASATRLAVQVICSHALAGDRRLLWTEQPTGTQLEEIERLLHEAYASVLTRLRTHWSAVQRLAQALIERQEMTGQEVRAVLGEVGRGA